MTDIQSWLDEARALADQATEGTWEAYADSDYQPAGCPPIIEHLVYAGAVETPIINWGNGSTKADATFIADARTRLPQALNALQAVLDLHKPEEYDGYPHSPDGVMCAVCLTEYNEYEEWPCPTVQAIQEALT